LNKCKPFISCKCKNGRLKNILSTITTNSVSISRLIIPTRRKEERVNRETLGWKSLHFLNGKEYLMASLIKILEWMRLKIGLEV
jgi:hypothetical protein